MIEMFNYRIHFTILTSDLSLVDDTWVEINTVFSDLGDKFEMKNFLKSSELEISIPENTVNKIKPSLKNVAINTLAYKLIEHKFPKSEIIEYKLTFISKD